MRTRKCDEPITITPAIRLSSVACQEIATAIAP